MRILGGCVIEDESVVELSPSRVDDWAPRQEVSRSMPKEQRKSLRSSL
jgi:hypothetical protein